MSPRSSLRPARLCLWLFSGLIFFFLIAPLVAIVPISFNRGAFITYPLEGFSLRWYQEFLSSADWLLAIKNSLIIGSATTVLATALGTLAALGLTHDKLPLKGAITAFVVSPMIVPIVIIAVGIYYFFIPLGLTRTYTGLILSHTMLATPLVVLTVTAALSGFDRNLIRAAFSLGAGPNLTFFKVILPLVAPGVISGAILAFSTSFDEVVFVIFLAGAEHRTLPRQMLIGLREYLNPTITAVATVLIALSVLLPAVIEILRRRTERLGGPRPAKATTL